jgi:8-oxo-dGTP diphosphatase
VTSTGLDQRTLDALLADARAAMTAYDDALAWLETAVKGPMEPVAAEVWAFDESFTRVLLVRHRWRGWVPPGGRVEAGRLPGRQPGGNSVRRPASTGACWGLPPP